MSGEEWDYEGEYKKCLLVSVLQLCTALVLLAVAEFLNSGFSPVQLEVLLEEHELGIVRTVFYVISALLILLAVLLKRSMRNLAPGPILSFLKGLIRQSHRRARASAVAQLIPPSAMCEMCAVLGFVFFILSGGSRPDLYILVSTAVGMMVLLFPTTKEKQNLISLDREIP